MTREVPLLVELAWDCLECHRYERCDKCSDSGFCAVLEVARARIRAWRRYRGVFGWRR